MADNVDIHSLLRDKVERYVGIRMQTRRHFDALAERIFANSREMVSSTTLRRFWGYQEKDSVAASHNTLNVLSRLIGYTCWDDFVSAVNRSDDGTSSELVQSMHILSSGNLLQGTRLQVTWDPDRLILLEYLGNCIFRVLESEHSKLCEGDTFRCPQIIAGQPMCCENLLRPGHAIMSYVCGRAGGLSFSILES